MLTESETFGVFRSRTVCIQGDLSCCTEHLTLGMGAAGEAQDRNTGQMPSSCCEAISADHVDVGAEQHPQASVRGPDTQKTVRSTELLRGGGR